jgi:hypothetical protein
MRYYFRRHRQRALLPGLRAPVSLWRRTVQTVHSLEAGRAAADAGAKALAALTIRC